MSLLTLLRELWPWGVARPLAGNSSSVSTASGSLTVAQALIGDSQSLSTAAGTLSVSQALAGDSASISSASGTLYDAEALTGDSDSISSASGNLTVAQALKGDSASVSSASGTLLVDETITGDSTSISSASGTLSGASGSTFLQLSGDSGSVSDAFASLFTRIPVDSRAGGGGAVYGKIGRLPKSVNFPKYAPPKRKQPDDVELATMPTKEEKVLVTVMGLTQPEVEEIVYDHNMQIRMDSIFKR